MKLKKWGSQSLIRKLSLIIFLSGCTTAINGNPYGFCPLVVTASPEVKADLQSLPLKPVTLKYLRDIGIQERDIQKYCK